MFLTWSFVWWFLGVSDLVPKAAELYTRYDFMMLNTHTQTRSMLSQAASAFIYRKHRLFIGGEWIDSFLAREMEGIDPFTRALLTHVDLSDTQDAERAGA